ncbi:hypothetical protein [Mucilaginibacter sp. AK015]|uniref:hypothetical protein n=1 Tax=Mucilaginibacter sp. AK015 TaxID=2723072 RepID=UPI0016135653|nr:hypothetical protein [Mucilaginibacter sp. AK015]MBB5395824.1 hypothetical protein [Mucilaginibacter sp. AK015]
MKRGVLKTIVLSIISMLFVLGVNAQQKGEPPVVKEGIQVSRTHLIKRIQSSDSSMLFKKTADSNGNPRYVGVDDNGTSVEIFGEEDLVKKAMFTFKFTTNRDINSIQYTRMSYFAFLLAGKKGLTWFEDCLSGFAKNPQRPIDQVEEFYSNLKGFFKYQPADKQIVVSFTD